MGYLIAADSRGEQVLCAGGEEKLQALARKLRASGLFRYVRVSASPQVRGPHHPELRGPASPAPEGKGP